MAQLAISLAGAAIGSFVGFPQLGFIAGSLLGAALFPDPPVKTEGPRLGDTAVSASTYGASIPLGYGTMRMAGNMIWSTGIVERSEVENSGGKGSLTGGTTQQQTTYSYFASFAFAFAQREAEAVIRIWADSKLIYDKTGQTTLDIDGLNFRFYKGDETQLPDPAIEADKGVGNVPAHRGMVYIVFDDLPLGPYGNRVPNITAEVAFRALVSNSVRFSADISTITSALSAVSLTVDRKRRRIYGASGSPDVIRIWNLDTLQETKQALVATDINDVGGPIHVGQYTGRIWIRPTASNNAPLVKVNQDTFEIEASIGSINAMKQATEVLAISTDLFGLPKQKPLIAVLQVFGLKENGIALHSADEQIAFISDDINSDNLIPSPVIGIAAGSPVNGDAILYAAHKPTGNFPMQIWKITVDSNVGPSLGPLFAIDRELLATLPTSTWDDAASGGTEGLGPIIDTEDGGLVFAVASRVFKWREGIGVVWKSVVGVGEPLTKANFVNNTKIEDHLVGWAGSLENACLVDTRDGTVIISALDVRTLDTAFESSNGIGFFDGPTQSLVYTPGPGIIGGKGRVQQVFLNRATGLGETLGGIVEDISGRIGLDPADLDTTGLTDTVAGYVLGRQVSARRALEPLASAFLFDGIESDDKVKFVKRGQDPALTITESQLAVAGDGGELLPEQRIQEVELPERVSVLYLDTATDYQQGTQSIKRIRQPVSSMNSRSEVAMALPMAMTSSEAKQIAEKKLFTIWNERTAYKWSTGLEFLKLDPSDVVSINLDSGLSLRSRISLISVGANLSLGFEGLHEDKTTFASLAASDGSLGFPQKLPPTPEFTNLFLLNLPLLRDADDTGQGSSRSYYAMGGFVNGWRGGDLFQSLDGGSSYNSLDRATGAMIYGTTVNALPDPGNLVWQIDETTQLEVALQTGQLSSVTELQFLNDDNVCIVGGPSLQNWEIVSFRDAVLQSNGNYLLSGLIRGKRGTEGSVATHTAGETMVVLRRDLVRAFLLALGQIGVSLLYKPVGFGSALENETPFPFTGFGNDLKPYAVAHPASSVDGPGNITLTWVRRTRVGGDLRDGIGTVPLSEATEAYEADIRNGLLGSVLRTLTSVTPSVVYTKAEQDVDFLAQAGTRLLATKFEGVDGQASAADIGPSVRVLTFVGNAQLDTGINTPGLRVLGMKFDGVDAATNAPEFSYAARTATFNGNAQLDTAEFKFGSASLLLDGVGDDVGFADSADWQFPGKFTIHGWIRPTSSVSHQIVSHWDDTGNQRSWALQKSGASKLALFYSFNGTALFSVVGTSNLPNDAWTHVAVTRDASNTIRLFVNGVQEHSSTVAGTFFDSTTTLRIGRIGNGVSDFNGHIDELEILKDIALWTANFTPPSQGLQEMGSALLLDGAGDRVTVPDSADWTLPGQFSIQAWVYPTSVTANRTVVSSYENVSPSNNKSWVLRVAQTTGILDFLYSLDGVALTTVSSTTAVPLNRWTHIAVSRDALGDIRLFINGVLDTSGGPHNQTAAFFNAATPLAIGAINPISSGGPNDWVGSIDELEIVKDAALWTAEFVPPQAGLSEVVLSEIVVDLYQISAVAGRGFVKQLVLPTT